MNSFIQFFLVVVISALTMQITFAAVQVFHILHEVRLALKRLNKILDHTHSLSTAATKPVTAVNEFFTEVKELVKNTQDEIIQSTPDRVIESTSQSLFTPSKLHRFFKRSGLPLRPS